MAGSNPSSSILTRKARHEVLENLVKAMDRKFYKADLLGPAWRTAVDELRPSIEAAPTPGEFELAVSRLLKTLETSHLGFFHDSAQRASSRAALSATYFAAQTSSGLRWALQDVHEGGPAQLAGLQSGNFLLRVNGDEIVPEEHPVFVMGSSASIDYVANDGRDQSTTVLVGRPKGKKLHFVEPTLVSVKKIAADVGYLKVAMFPGMIGVDVAADMSRAAGELEGVPKLIVDLRGNTGGGVGALRLMSLLTPHKTPAGFSPGRKWASRELDQAKGGFPRLSGIPGSKAGLWLLGARFLPSLMVGTPVVLESEGLGSRSFHGNVVILVNRHTASAAEMVVMFAKENRLATVVGERTAGRLLSATSVKVGHGYRFALPTGAYHTWNGAVLEGSPIDPDVVAPFDLEQRRAGIDTQIETALRVVTSQEHAALQDGQTTPL